MNALRARVRVSVVKWHICILTIKYNSACRSNRDGNHCSYFEIKHVCLTVICWVRVRSKVPKPWSAHTRTSFAKQILESPPRFVASHLQNSPVFLASIQSLLTVAATLRLDEQLQTIRFSSN